MLNKIISFTLFGNIPKYTVGMIKNLDLAKKFYPDWICRIYLGNTVPKDIISEIEKRNNQEIVYMNESGNFKSFYWRFLAAGDSDIMICRDSDSRIYEREVEAVNDWIVSNKSFHIMRDHPYHSKAIMGGLWGVKYPKLKNISVLIDKFEKKDEYSNDQLFLEKIIYPMIKNDCIIHDEFYSKKPFPSKRKEKKFVGQGFDHNDLPLLAGRKKQMKDPADLIDFKN